MVTYVQIGKGPRMAINDTVKNVKKDFIKQIPKFKTLVPIYFFPNKSTDEWSGVLIPYRGSISGTVYFIYKTHEEYWDLWNGNITARKIDWRDYKYKVYPIEEMYAKKGYKGLR